MAEESNTHLLHEMKEMTLQIQSFSLLIKTKNNPELYQQLARLNDNRIQKSLTLKNYRIPKTFSLFQDFKQANKKEDLILTSEINKKIELQLDNHLLKFKGKRVEANQNFLNTFYQRGRLFSYFSYFITFILMFLSFISRKKENLELQMANSEELHRNLFQNLHESVILLNSKGEILQANESASSHFKIDSRQLKAFNIDDLFPILFIPNQENVSFKESQIFKSIEKDESLEHFLFGFRYKSFETKWVNANLSHFNTNLGKVFVLSFEDITHLIRAKELIQKQQESLIHSSKMSALGQMSGGIAHEINNPLAIINSEAEDLKDIAEEEGQVDAGEAMSIAQNIEKTASRISKIVKGLKILARDGESDEMEPFSLNLAIHDVIAISGEKFKSKGVLFESNIAENLGQSIGREVQFIQVLVNLLNNAFDAIEGQKEKIIKIRAYKEDEHVFVDIEDNGPGIPENVVKKIFDPFFTTKKVGKGTGLGLSLSQSIMLEHNGSLKLIEHDNKTIFQIKIPQSRANKAA